MNSRTLSTFSCDIALSVSRVVAPASQAGCRPLHRPRSAPGLERMPDHLIQSVGLEERPQVFDARFAVGGEQLLDELRALPTSPRARHEACEIPRDGTGAYVLEIVPDQ